MTCSQHARFSGSTPRKWTAALTLLLVLVAWRQLTQLAIAQREQTRPYVSLRPTFRGQMLCLTLENTGRTAAHTVRVSFV